MKDFAIRFSIGLAVATGATLLSISWVFVIAGFRGLIYLYALVEPWRIGMFILTCATGYAVAHLVPSRRSR